MFAVIEGSDAVKKLKTELYDKCIGEYTENGWLTSQNIIPSNANYVQDEYYRRVSGLKFKIIWTKDSNGDREKIQFIEAKYCVD